MFLYLCLLVLCHLGIHHLNVSCLFINFVYQSCFHELCRILRGFLKTFKKGQTDKHAVKFMWFFVQICQQYVHFVYPVETNNANDLTRKIKEIFVTDVCFKFDFYFLMDSNSKPSGCSSTSVLLFCFNGLKNCQSFHSWDYSQTQLQTHADWLMIWILSGVMKKIGNRTKNLFIFSHFIICEKNHRLKANVFFTLTCQFIISDLDGQFLTLKIFLSPNYSTFAVECDWISEISQYVQNLGFFLKKIDGFFKKTQFLTNFRRMRVKWSFLLKMSSTLSVAFFGEKSENFWIWEN